MKFKRAAFFGDRSERSFPGLRSACFRDGQYRCIDQADPFAGRVSYQRGQRAVSDIAAPSLASHLQPATLRGQKAAQRQSCFLDRRRVRKLSGQAAKDVGPPARQNLSPCPGSQRPPPALSSAMPFNSNRSTVPLRTMVTRIMDTTTEPPINISGSTRSTP